MVCFFERYVCSFFNKHFCIHVVHFLQSDVCVLDSWIVLKHLSLLDPKVFFGQAELIYHKPGVILDMLLSSLYVVFLFL